MDNYEEKEKRSKKNKLDKELEFFLTAPEIEKMKHKNKREEKIRHKNKSKNKRNKYNKNNYDEEWGWYYEEDF